MSQDQFSGRVWIIADSQNRLIENIDTDQIYHNAHLHITDIGEMGRFALGNLAGWEDFPNRCAPGDVLIAGRNFGAGSSRQQAVDCFRALRLAMLIASSFGAIYFRNAVNSGFPLLRAPELSRKVESGELISGDTLEVNIRTGEGRIARSGESLRFDPMSRVQYDIYKAGGLFAFGKK